MDLQDTNLNKKQICVVGMGYVGLTLALTLSDTGFGVVGIDKREKVVKNLRQGKTHFYEKGLEQILRRELGKGFKFLTFLEKSISSIYIVAVGTPVEENKKPRFDDLKEATQSLGRVLKKGDLVILRSTVPPGTMRNVVLPILESFSSLKGGEDFYLAFAPERTIEGAALTELRTLPQVIGGINKKSSLYAANIFEKITSKIIIVNNLESAEMVKIINNLYRDVNFAFANEIALVCDKFNIDAVEVINAANFGYSRSNISAPSPGVGGYCLTKDTYILKEAAIEKGYSPQLINCARRINEQMPNYVVAQIEKFFKKHNKNFETAKIFLMGFSFKGRPDTSDIRFSPTIDVLNKIKSKIPNIYGYDPVVEKETVEHLGVVYSSAEDGFRDADCVVVMNNHPSFESLDVLRYLETTNRPSFFIDTWRLHAPEKILKVKHVDYSNLGFDTLN